MLISENNIVRPKLLRHLAVMAYDSLLLLATLLVATLIMVAFNNGHAISDGNPFFLAYLLCVSFFFYGWFWTHGGQTIGMRSWKVFLVSNTNTKITWQRAFMRFSFALLAWLPMAAGFWWQYLGKDHLSWPDLFSGTRLHFDKNSQAKSVSPLS